MFFFFANPPPSKPFNRSCPLRPPFGVVARPGGVAGGQQVQQLDAAAVGEAGGVRHPGEPGAATTRRRPGKTGEMESHGESQVNRHGLW